MLRKTFSLDSSLYSEESILQAIEDFGADFDISLSERNLTIGGNSDAEVSEIFNELMNYVLPLENPEL